MKRAIELAVENVRLERGGPFGAVIVRDGVVVAEGYNIVTSSCDPTAHAEVTTIRWAAAALKTFNLSGCDIYSSCEPCPMCLGAIYWAHIERIYYGCTQHDAADAGFDDSEIYREIGLPMGERKIPIVGIVREAAIVAFDAWRASGMKIEY